MFDYLCSFSVCCSSMLHLLSVFLFKVCLLTFVMACFVECLILYACSVCRYFFYVSVVDCSLFRLRKRNFVSVVVKFCFVSCLILYVRSVFVVSLCSICWCFAFCLNVWLFMFANLCFALMFDDLCSFSVCCFPMYHLLICCMLLNVWLIMFVKCCFVLHVCLLMFVRCLLLFSAPFVDGLFF